MLNVMCPHAMLRIALFSTRAYPPDENLWMGALHCDGGSKLSVFP